MCCLELTSHLSYKMSYPLQIDIDVQRFSPGFVFGIAALVKESILALAIVRFRHSRL